MTGYWGSNWKTTRSLCMGARKWPTGRSIGNDREYSLGRPAGRPYSRVYEKNSDL